MNDVEIDKLINQAISALNEVQHGEAVVIGSVLAALKAEIIRLRGVIHHDERKQEILNLAIETYGEKQQLNQTNEELAELIVEVAKHIRGYNNRYNIIEEMADVLHCFEYLKILLNISDDEIIEV